MIITTFCFDWCLGFGYMGFMVWDHWVWDFVFRFLLFPRSGSRDLLSYGSHTVFVVTW
jgi:hypothetical protein